MAARKTAKKKTAKKRTSKKKAVARKKAPRRTALLGSELPRSLAAFTRQLRRDLNAIEHQLESASKGTRRSLARVLRDASHQLGVLEARGQKAWRARSRKAQRDVESMMRRVRRATNS